MRTLEVEGESLVSRCLWTRDEVSLSNSLVRVPPNFLIAWRLADIDYPEDTYRNPKYADLDLFGGKLDMSWRDKCYCWCFWKLKIAVAELVNAKDIVVRAMDEAMNLQPKDM